MICSQAMFPEGITVLVREGFLAWLIHMNKPDSFSDVPHPSPINKCRENTIAAVDELAMLLATLMENGGL